MSQAVLTDTVFGADLIHFDFLDSVNITTSSAAPTKEGAAMQALAYFRTHAPYELEDGMLQAEDITTDMIQVTKITEGT